MKIFYDFFMMHGFVFELVIANILFVISLKRQKYFVLKLSLSLASMLVISVIWNFLNIQTQAWNIIKYILLFGMTAFAIKLCYKTSFWSALFCAIGGYATQHCAFRVARLIQIMVASEPSPLLDGAIYIATMLVIYILFFLLFANKVRNKDETYLADKQVLLLGIALLLFTTAFEAFIVDIKFSSYIIFAAYDFLCCIFTLSIQYNIFKSSKMQGEFKVMEHILHIQKEQYNVSKETMDIINIKCHDLKHHITRFKDRLNPDEIDELSRAFNIYDMSVKTENEVLDVVLAEKSLVCGNENIKLNCIADGKSLNFMRAADIYTLFGNAIDNSIKAVGKLEDISKRVISISVKESMGMLAIHFENFYSGDLSFENDLPITTHSDKDYHGFGMKSMKMLIEQYGGFFSVKTVDNVFNVNILLTIPATK